MYRVLIPSALVIVISLISRPASAQPASVVATLPVVAALVGFAVLALALYLPKREPQDESGELVEARDFVRLASPQPIATSAGIEVAIVFAYDDPNSYYLEPLLARWAREYPEEIAVIRLPATETIVQRHFARTFFAMRALGVAERLHGILFDAVHIAKCDLSDEERVARFLATHGVDPLAFLKHFRSSVVQSQLLKAEVMNKGYEMGITPALIVNGTFKITPKMAGSLPHLLDKLDRLSRKAIAN